MSLCYKTSNNKYFDCPPRMNDGRHFTDYTSNCYTNNLIRADNNIQNNFEYRQFLTNNAEKIMDMNRAYSCQKNCCGKCKELDKNTMLPEQSLTTCNSENCKTLITDENGLGNGRYYGINPSMEEIKNRTSNCSNWSNGLPINQPKNSCGQYVMRFIKGYASANIIELIPSVIVRKLNCRRINRAIEQSNII